MRINKVNYRREFFRVPWAQVRTLLADKGYQTTFTLLAEAHDYRETQVLNKMNPAEREKYNLQGELAGKARLEADAEISSQA